MVINMEPFDMEEEGSIAQLDEKKPKIAEKIRRDLLDMCGSKGYIPL